MPRAARNVRSGLPHHITQRGNRRQQTFFSDYDYHFYRQRLSEECRLSAVRIWAYCLLPNHVHLLLVPETAEGLTAAVSQTHRRYTTMINKREGWTGHLWQGRYGSDPIRTDAALINAVRYIERNPVAAGLVASPQDWPWSSAREHMAEVAEPILDDSDLRKLVPNWKAFLDDGALGDMMFILPDGR